MALDIDAEYYADLWVNSHRIVPRLENPPPDPAFGDSYLGNGYFPTWCADVARRLLQRAAEDPRFGFGESILTLLARPPARTSKAATMSSGAFMWTMTATALETDP